MEYVIGVDIGTTNTKAIATDVTGKTHFRFETANETITPAPGHYEQDPEVLYETVKSCIAAVSAQMKTIKPDARLVAVSFSSAMHGLVVLDEKGNPLINCWLWSDSRSAETAQALKGTPLGNELYQHTGTPIHAMSPLCKIAWMRANTPEVHTQTARFISVKEYVFFRLFGEFLIDYSIASATGLFDIRRYAWHGPALEFAGITEAQLSRPVAVTHQCSGLQTADALEMGITSDTPFVLGGSDGCLANAGVGAIRPGVAAVTIGTSGAVRVAQDSPKTDPNGRVFSYVLTPDVHIVGGAVNNGGNVLGWFLEHLYRDGTATEGLSFASLMARAGAVSPGADGLVFLPYLLGERAPLWDASAKGAYVGVRMHHGNAHFARATVEGIVYGLYHVGKVLLEHTGPIRAIHATGGFFDSEFCVQLLADVFNTPVLVKDDADGSALGAVLIAWHALGYLPELEFPGDETAAQLCYPDAERHMRYMQAFGQYTRFSSLLNDKLT